VAQHSGDGNATQRQAPLRLFLAGHRLWRGGRRREKDI